MTFAKLIPVILSVLLLAAHFSRAGLQPLVVFFALFPALLLVKRAWVARLTQVMLALGAIEWIRTLFVLAADRREIGQPWTRLAVILGIVALFTAGSALLFSLSSALRKRYRLEENL